MTDFSAALISLALVSFGLWLSWLANRPKRPRSRRLRGVLIRAHVTRHAPHASHRYTPR
jgi:hypothetical protein